MYQFFTKNLKLKTKNFITNDKRPYFTLYYIWYDAVYIWQLRGTFLLSGKYTKQKNILLYGRIILTAMVF